MVKKSELIEKGYILCKVIIELLGKPKNHVDQTMSTIVQKLKEEKDIVILDTQVFDAQENEAGMFSAFVEIELMFKDIPRMLGFCIDYMPASLEIEEPHSLTFQQAHLSGVVNDFIRRVHDVDSVAKTKNAENLLLAQTVRELLKRSILYTLKAKPQTAKDISDDLAVMEDEIKTYLKLLENEKLVKKKGDKYSLA